MAEVKHPLAWFEFVFDPTGTLLENHLKDAFAVPSAAQLIVQFLERSKVPPSTNTPVPDGSLPTESKRSRHLKQLALQVAYHLDWNLEALENGLTLQWQDYLFSQLLKIIPSACIDGDLNSIDLRSAMALIIYHRWVIRTLAQHFLPNVGKVKNGTLEAATNDVILKTLKDQLPSSIQILEKALTITQDLELPCSPQQQQVSPQMTPPSLSSLAAAQTTQGGATHGGATQGEKEGKASCNGIADGEVVKSTVNGTTSKVKQVKKEDIIAQVSFDLGTLYFYQEKFGDALKLFQHCKEAKRCKSSLYTVDECELHGYHMACCGILGEDVRHQWSRVASQGKVPLLEQVEQSKRSGNKDLVTLLLQDNIHTELPMDYRLYLAAEVPKSPADSLATGESVTLACQVQACNTLRLIMEGKAIQHEFWDSLKTCSTEELRCLLSLCVKSTEIIKSTPLIADKDQHIRVLKSFVSLVCNSATKVNGAEVLQDEKFSLFAPAKKPDEVGDLKRKMPREPLQFKQLLEDFVSTGADLEYSNAIARLRACYDAQEISALVDKLRQLKPNRNLHNEEYKISVSLLRYALEQIEGLTLGPVERIRNSLHQELLVLDIKLNSGKNKNEDLSEQVKSYIWQTGKRTDLQPSIERHTVAYLLNNKETAFLTNLMNEMEDVHNTDYRLLGGLLATTCSSITKPQGWRKPVRQLWDGVLRVFSSTTQQKRPQEGPGISIRRDATNINLSGFLCFVDKIKVSFCKGVHRSMLCTYLP
ncbi:integrator complex subunit 8 isoform X2 [Nematostella vectensis]|uniref:integrator complex subunit 8 isoform X2 n=1 Tax=Nematostella vectensis TaxID=45351 RepID=UPI0020776247|nr:integrator complex subunit 8 isoform X2 [Nematostella vectensis]